MLKGGGPPSARPLARRSDLYGSGDRLRAVQWTTGKTASAAVRSVAAHPVQYLVCRYAYSRDMVGRDVGDRSARRQRDRRHRRTASPAAGLR
jgi:hypothetical protein